jgi:archaellum biogenesis protein FlaJ (TadC family)
MQFQKIKWTAITGFLKKQQSFESIQDTANILLLPLSTVSVSGLQQSGVFRNISQNKYQYQPLTKKPTELLLTHGTA